MPIVDGHATRQATEAHASRFSSVQHGVLGRSELHCSQAGFGCYRVADGVDAHREALHQALAGGINLIDTSANYGDGGSEVLVGKVLTELIGSGSLTRAEIIVVTKAGYLQGHNYAMSQARKAQGRPYPDLVTYADGLEHCIHPAFLEDQLTASLARLNLATADFFLLHNPEYYLNWAAGQGRTQKAARAEYHRRLDEAFRHLEQEVARGRIQYYGISSNTFPEPSDRKDFTCFQRVLELADRLGPDHHFRLIQFPMNLMESGAVLNPNQPDGATLLGAVRQANVAALVNRPLNALGPEGLLRLADIDARPPLSDGEIVQTIQKLRDSETELLEDILPSLEIPAALASQIEAQVRIAPALLRQYQAFSSYDRWCQIRDAHLISRVEAVLAYFDRQVSLESLRQWAEGHGRRMAAALEAITAFYAPSAIERAQKLKDVVRGADEDWAENGRLSQLAIRALRTTDGISCVLVGMRRPGYVQDVLEELQRSRTTRSRGREWAFIAEKVETTAHYSVEEGKEDA